MINYTTLRFAACVAVLMGASAVTLPAQQPQSPTIDDVISLRRVGTPEISPDGKLVAYTVRETNWDQNQYETNIWVADAATGVSWRLTNAKKSSTNPAWSPDGSKILFASDRSDKRQLYLINPRGGEAEQLAPLEEAPGGFAWSPDGRFIAYTASDARSDADKDREKKFGDFLVVDGDFRQSHLYVLDVATRKSRQVTKGTFTVGRFNWSPDGSEIAFDHRINGANANGGTADISVVNVATGAVRSLVKQDGPDVNPVWSADGKRIAFQSAMMSPSHFYTNSHIAVVPATGGAIEDVSAAFDEDPTIIKWTKEIGILFSAAARTSSGIYFIRPESKRAMGGPEPERIGTGFSFSADGMTMAYAASGPTSVPEIYVTRMDAMVGEARKLTDFNAQTSAWAKAPIEVVTWKSKDGATIEGILHKPIGFTAGTKYPLLVVIHGGPTGVSRPIPYASAGQYPIDVWVGKGALVLEPNYRGSAGYGEKFRSLNVRNLGVGDAWDVLSGVDNLVKEGLADSTRVGVMGWSQGGYISAFLATHDPARFKAISVGAGISNWMTYYVNTDITPFTRQYLKGTPWDDPEIYAKTSPMTYIKGARTPTLIQHGATDQRVPLPDAYELYRGLQDMHVPSKLIVYRGFEGIGHGPSRPKSSRAVMQHNLDWFGQYLWGEPAVVSSTER